MKQIIVTLLLALGCLSYASAGPITGVVVQGNGSKAQFEHAVKLAENMHQILKHAQFQVVVFGPIVKALTTFSPKFPPCRDEFLFDHADLA